MPLANQNALLTDWAATAPYASLHSAWSATGGNELTGGSPAYARQAVTWGSPAAGAMSLSGTPYTFNCPASSTAAWVGYWSALTSGTFAGMFPAGNYTAFTFTAPSSTDVLFAPGSAYSNGTTVVVLPTAGSVLPTGLSEGTIYYVIAASSDSFQLSATSGGSAINLTADGSGLVQQIASQSFVSQSTTSLSGGTVTAV
jgi:hypothetical protein